VQQRRMGHVHHFTTSAVLLCLAVRPLELLLLWVRPVRPVPASTPSSHRLLLVRRPVPC
jgi:hypothetical protein